jgi:hypothetical protein
MYDGDQSNSVRFEDAGAAIAAGETLGALWRAHPHVFQVPACERLEEKIAAVRQIIADAPRS